MPSATTKMGRGFLSIHHQIVAAASPAVYAVSRASLSAQSRVSVEPID